MRRGLAAVVALVVLVLAACSSPEEQLFEAIANNDPEAIDKAVEAGAEIDGVGPGGLTPLVAAIYEGRIDVVRHLVEEAGTEILTADPGEPNAYQVALEADQPEIADLLFTMLEPIGEERWVDSEDGLRLRAQPYLEAETMTVLGHGTQVFVEGQSHFDREIGGVTGRWARVTVERRPGWVFDAYLRDEPLVPLRLEVPYVAHHATGRRGTDARRSDSFQVLFLPENRVWYSHSVDYFDGSSERTHPGEYVMQNDGVLLHLETGIGGSAGPGGSMPPEPEPVEGFTVRLRWLDEVRGFLQEELAAEVLISSAYDLDQENRRYRKDDGDDYEYVGYLTARQTFQIGDIGPAGGVVYYDKGSYSDGWRFLEAARSDLSKPHAWGPNEYVGATGTAIGDGEPNTQVIVEALGSAAPAALQCMQLEIGGHDDWFLPSRDEVVEMYNQRFRIGRFRVPSSGFCATPYSTSSEWKSEIEELGEFFGPWDVCFATGEAGGDSFHLIGGPGCTQTVEMWVRPVRAF